MKDYDGIGFAIVGFLVTFPFAIWKWIDLIVIFVKWFGSHWN